MRAGVSLGDTLAALHGVIGVLLALQARQRTGRGQVVDVALYESVFNCMESLLPEYSAFGAVREPAGSALPGIAPSNAYRCADGQVVIGGNGDSIFKRLMSAIGRDDLGQDPALAGNAGRAARVDELDAAITAWTVQRPVRRGGRDPAAGGARAGGPHLHRPRHRRRPALPRPRQMIETITTAKAGLSAGRAGRRRPSSATRQAACAYARRRPRWVSTMPRAGPPDPALRRFKQDPDPLGAFDEPPSRRGLGPHACPSCRLPGPCWAVRGLMAEGWAGLDARWIYGA